MRRPKVPKTVDELGTYLRSLSESNLDMYGDMFVEMFRGYCVDEARLQQAVALIFDTTVADREYVHLGVMVCQKIKEQDKTSRFTKALLLHFQKNFSKKNEIRAISIEAWLAIFAFMCDVYSCILTDSGQPISVLGRAIFSTIDYLLSLKDCVDDEIECICSSLKLCGALLEAAQGESMKKTIDALRRKVLMKNSSCRVRCLIMEVLELRAMGWKDPQKSLEDFYIDSLQDAIVEDEVGES